MKKSGAVLLRFFPLLASLEAAAAFILLISIPGDPKNNALFGFSIQRLVMAGALLGAFLVLGGVHFFGQKKILELWEKWSSHRGEEPILVFWHALCVFLIAGGFPVLMRLAESPVVGAPVWDRLFPLLGWLGVVGIQGLVVLFWIDATRQEVGIGRGLQWSGISALAAASGAYLLWFAARPADAGLPIATNLAVVGGSVFVLFALVLNRPERRYWWFGLAASLALCLIPLAAYWASGASDLNFLTGLFPFNDAHGYYLGARRMAEGLPMNTFAARRPLFPGFLGFLLGISSQNLQFAILALVLLAGAAAFFFADEIRRTHGAPAAALSFLLVFFFLRRFIGSTMTETQGLAMGAAGIALIWRSIAGKKSGLFYLGLACLSVALNARAGPFFILPAIVLWAAFYFRGARRFSWRVLVIGGLAAGAGFAANLIVFKATANENSVPFSNFSYTLYGTAVGGMGWKQIFVDHPDVLDLQEPEFSRQIFTYTLDAIKRNPANLIKGSLVAWKSLFSLDFYGMFGFIQGQNDNLEKAIRAAMFVLSLAGLAGAFARWKSGLAQFVLASAAGILLSVPFVPPLDGEIRTYAAVIPLFAILASLGLWELIQIARRLGGSQGYAVYQTGPGVVFEKLPGRPAVGFTVIYCLAVVLGPILVRTTARPPVVEKYECPSGQEAVIIRINPGSYVQVVPDNAAAQTWLPVIRETDFIRSIHDFPFYEITTELDPLVPPATLTFAYDLTGGEQVLLVADTRILPRPTGLFGVCGRWTPNLAKYGYGFFYADSVQEIEDISSDE